MAGTPGLIKLPGKAGNMARQAGPLLITGTRSNLTFYKMNGRYYARLKSSLSSKRVKTSPAFARTMLYANRLALCSRIASRLYRSMPVAAQQVALYRKMTSTALQLLKAGIGEDRLAAALAAVYIPAPAISASTTVLPAVRAMVTSSGQLVWYFPEVVFTIHCPGKSPPRIKACRQN